MKIIYEDEYHTAEFDKERYLTSLRSFGVIDEEKAEEVIRNRLEAFPLRHVSVLVKEGVGLFTEEEGARRYYEAHQAEGVGFERLARITGLCCN